MARNPGNCLKRRLQCRDTDGGQSSRPACEAGLGSEEDLDDYFVRSQELMTRLSDAGEAITVINGLPDSYEQFVAQESFQPAKTFPELRTRLSN